MGICVLFLVDTNRNAYLPLALYMTENSFQPENWVVSLSQVVAKVAAEQASHQGELDELHQHGIRRETERPRPVAPYHPSKAFRSLYWRACSGSGLYYEQRYGLLRAALVEARHVLAAHPVLADLVDPTDAKADFVIRINSGGGLGTLSGIVAGQIARAIEVGDHGLEMAATELNALLEPLDAQPPTRAFSDLSTGFHVVLLYGLQIGDETTVTGETAIVPFRKLEAFVNRSVIGDLVPKVINYGTWNAVGAIVEPFRWKPQFLKANDRSEPGLDWGGSFFEDAKAFTELLALFHAGPVIALATIPYCIHRTAAHLLGQAHYHTGYGWGPSVRDFDVLSESNVSLRPMCIVACRFIGTWKSSTKHVRESFTGDEETHQPKPKQTRSTRASEWPVGRSSSCYKTGCRPTGTRW